MSTAVILAARKERFSEVPYPLRPLDGDICLMDRTLELLQELNYTQVFIVVGYHSELFSVYQNEGIRLVINQDYAFTSSMYSLSLVSNLVEEDFLLIEGDTFFEKCVLEKLSRILSGNCLTTTEESGSGDECYVETKSGFITKITKDRHQVCRFEGELIGVSRISLATFHKMIDAYTEFSSPPLLNYEYLFMEVTDTLDRPFIFFKNLIWGDVDTEEDYHRLQNSTWRALRRKEDPFDKDNLKQYLTIIFPGKDISTAEIEQIGGMSNKNFRINFLGNSYVLRVPGNGAEGMVERSNEAFNSQEGSNLGINPKVRFFDARSGIKLTDYILNAETLNSATIQRRDNMIKVVEIYSCLHNSHIRLKNEFHLFHEILKYQRLITKGHATMYPGWKKVQARIMALESRLNQLGVDVKPCHNDAVPENFIRSGDNLYLIDWEYSGMNDPMADFAALFLESGFTQENESFVLSKYFNDGFIPESIPQKILCYQILWDYLWAQWTIIKESKGDDFGSYGRDRYERAILNLTKLA